MVAPAAMPASRGASGPLTHTLAEFPRSTGSRAPAPTAAPPGARPWRRPRTRPSMARSPTGSRSPAPTAAPPGARHELITDSAARRPRVARRRAARRIAAEVRGRMTVDKRLTSHVIVISARRHQETKTKREQPTFNTAQNSSNQSLTQRRVEDSCYNGPSWPPMTSAGERAGEHVLPKLLFAEAAV